MAALNILVGALLLLFGRRLFWLFVAAMGFIVGTTLANEWFGNESAGVFLVIALVLGILGAIVSLFLQRLVVGIAGFFAGGYVLHTLAVGWGFAMSAWIPFLIGGVLGAILLMVVFDWALIALSAMTGATLIIENVHPQGVGSGLLFIALLVLGVIVQTRQLSRSTTQTSHVDVTDK